jgi:glycosyltransferase involved in cell wall biosynthesis
MSIAVIIPCYNEAKTVVQVVESYKQHLPEADIYVYDNNSTDDTVSFAHAAGAIVRKETRQGKGNVIRTMFRDIVADCYLIVDGDDTYPADAARAMCDAVLNDGADMVVGDRLSSTYFTENKRPFHNTGNVLVRKLVNMFFKGDIKDIMTGYRAFSPLFVKSFPVLSKGFEIETEMTIHALDKNLNIVSIPIDYRDRPKGSESKLNTFSDGFKVLFTIFKLYKDYRPLPFFSLIAGLLLLLAFVLALPVLITFFQTGFVDRFPTLIVAGFIMIASLLSFSCGLILDTENKKARQNFEVQLNLIKMLQLQHTNFDNLNGGKQ